MRPFSQSVIPSGVFAARNLSSIVALFSKQTSLSFRAKRGVCFSLAAGSLAFLAFCVPVAPPTLAPPRPPAISGIAFVRISVSSLDESRKFFADGLGLSRLDQCWDSSAAECFFVKPLQEVQITRLADPQSKDLVDAIGMLTADAGTLREYLIARGEKPGGLQRRPGGAASFEIADPEGHRLVFVSTHGVAASILGGNKHVGDSIIHAGIVVHDRAVEDKFYKDVLGFHVYWHGGMKDGEDNWVDMQVPEGTDWIEYMLNVSPNASHRTLGVMNHIALGVPDIHAAQQQLLRNGMKLNEEPKIGRDGKWQLNLYDPDETRVELMEFTPSQKPCCSEYTGPHPKP